MDYSNNFYGSRDEQNKSFPGALTVTQLNEFVKRTIEGSPQLNNVCIKGEISNFKNHYSTGHFYFTLKDENSQLSVVMFRSYASRLRFIPEDGMKVTARGSVTAYVKGGNYQLMCSSMEPDGIGSLYIAYEQLKERLEAEGLFSEARKKPLPKNPMTVGIITSATGAVIQDIKNVSRRRFPAAELILYPSLVQGDEAPANLIEGLKYFNGRSDIDVIIIGRGGGSIEDLWAFNSEELARAVAASRIPVISAVGHETDFTICDFVADKRAPTPSAAAEIALPDTQVLKKQLTNLVSREANVILRKISEDRTRLSYQSRSHVLTNPFAYIEEKRMELDSAAESLCEAERDTIDHGKESLALFTGKLSALNPMAVLSRGYSAVFNEENSLVKKVSDMRIGSDIVVKTTDGSAECTVNKIRTEKNNG